MAELKTGKGCLYIKRLSDVNLDVLTEMVAASILDLRQTVEETRAASKRKA